MPLIKNSNYNPPLYYRNGHLQTIYASFFRKLDGVNYHRERIYTQDNDFLDLDWSKIGSNKLAIISHGLEGDSHRSYVVGMVKILNNNGWDVLAWNYRSCSGEINRTPGFYHNGSIEDLDCVIQHALAKHQYPKIVLTGFSMGGNLNLVYLGKNGSDIDNRIERAVVFSVPCDLKASSEELAKFKCQIYMRRFLKKLHHKIKLKMEMMPDRISDKDFHLIKNFKHYDDRYTAPLHGFKSAEDYWQKCSSRQYIAKIQVPTLIVNALNDPFLAGGCYPYQEASHSKYVHLETPESGGHVGFLSFNKDKSYWSENRTIEFLNNNSSNNRNLNI